MAFQHIAPLIGSIECCCGCVIVFCVGYWGLKTNVETDIPCDVLTHLPEREDVSDHKDLKESIQRSLSDVTGDRIVSAEDYRRRSPIPILCQWTIQLKIWTITTWY
jgi:hypothetical protein